MPMSSATRVLVSHAEPLIHRGIAATLGGDARFQVSEQDPGPIELPRWNEAPLHVLVTDLPMGIATAARLGEQPAGRDATAPAVLVLSHSDGELNVRGALERGVKGYLTQGCRPEQLVDAVLALGRGQRYLDSSVVRRLADAVSLDLPTPREADVLRLMATGLCNKAIAAQLNIGCGTVKTHVKALLDKLDAPTRTAAADIAKRRGLLDVLVEDLTPGRAHRRPVFG